jgi:NAD(P)-dependent dehydrogenase (short-subunit alcohol dehydrogenase family)
MPISKQMEGEVVVITGGSSGIGLAVAQHFAARGARVVLAARDAARLDAAVATLGGTCRAHSTDITNDHSVSALMESIEANEGRIDCLINCAGVLEIGPAEEHGVEVAERLMQTNYLGAVRVLQAALPLLRRGSRRSIVNVSSLAGKVAPPFMACYSASKFALAAYTYALRQEVKREGFHVGLVSPGPVDTPMLEGRLPGEVEHYPVPPGVPLIKAEDVARKVGRAVDKRQNDVVVPAHLSPLVRLGQAAPPAVDLVYGILISIGRRKRVRSTS